VDTGGQDAPRGQSGDGVKSLLPHLRARG
jgi:hypothetical protein